ncbi:MAG: ABC transporter ATP-binding protein [Acidobacteriota bacterium]
MELLKTENLFVGFSFLSKFQNVLKDINLLIKKNETFALIGESGSGKTLFALSILRLLPRNGKVISGNIFFEGKNLTNLEEKELRLIRGRKISIIFQEPLSSLNPVLKIGAQISESIRQWKQSSKKETREKTIEILKEVGFLNPEKWIDSYPHELSGGMRQRVLIAMALSLESDLLIADEPTSALDRSAHNEIVELLLKIKEERGISMILISHDIGFVEKLADRVGIIYSGEIMEVGEKKDIISNPFHPYTSGLLKSLPKYWKERRKKVYAMEGFIPSTEETIKSCLFYPRCERKMEICKIDKPGLKKAINREVRCWLYE